MSNEDKYGPLPPVQKLLAESSTEDLVRDALQMYNMMHQELEILRAVVKKSLDVVQCGGRDPETGEFYCNVVLLEELEEACEAWEMMRLDCGAQDK